MSFSSNLTQVLNKSTYDVLSESGENVAIRDGWQTIKCITLSESSSPDQSEGSIEVPTVIESLETLQFLGFTPEAGRRILARFEDASDLMEDPYLLDFAKGQIRSVPDVGCPEDDWNGAILAMGITQTLSDKILDPEFRDLRLTQNASYWVRDTIEAKFLFLTSLDSNILGLRASAQGPVSLQARLERSKKSSGASSQAQKHKAEQEPQPQAISDTELMLLKGGDYARLQKAIKLDTDLTAINRIQNVGSALPGDFAGLTTGLYLTTQRQLAYQYASYARKRLETANGENPIAVGILQVVVPRDLTAGAVDIHGETRIWQEFVWNHRLQRQTPSHLRWIDDAPVVMGPVVRCSQDNLRKLVSDGRGYEALEPLAMNLAGGKSASQFCLNEAELMRKINEQGRFKIEVLRW